MSKTSAKWTVLHNDHDISIQQMEYIGNTVCRISPALTGFFIQQVSLPPEMGTVPCGLYGPAMDDEIITEDEVTYEVRGDRPWKDRLINKPLRPVNYVQVIGTVEGGQYTVFTVYGGPLAPQNAEDPSNEDVESSKMFWAEHALVAREPSFLGSLSEMFPGTKSAKVNPSEVLRDNWDIAKPDEIGGAFYRLFAASLLALRGDRELLTLWHKQVCQYERQGSYDVSAWIQEESEFLVKELGVPVDAGTEEYDIMMPDYCSYCSLAIRAQQLLWINAVNRTYCASIPLVENNISRLRSLLEQSRTCSAGVNKTIADWHCYYELEDGAVCSS